MYTEILKLKEMLEQAKIPFEWDDKHFDGYHLIYAVEDEQVCSVIEFFGSYGASRDLLEIMGLMTEEEQRKTGDEVLGNLTAENVFNRIKSHWDKTEGQKAK